ncbi:MAG: methyltransferase family protein [Promethearchaeota archaeon]
MIDLLKSVKFEIFLIDLICSHILLIGITWSVIFPKKRVWPPPKKASWQYLLSWILFYMAFCCNALLFVVDWDTWIMTNPLRYIIAIPLIILGSLLASWGIFILGAKNTSGIKDKFITKGPYRFTRNPQYLGDITLFIGLTIFANSEYLLITHFLLSLVFIITPLAEESWLERQYGENYLKYKKQTPRFL